MRCAGSLDDEHEVVAGVVFGGVDERVQQFLLVGSPVDVDVLRRPSASGEAELQREAALQQPSALGYGEQSGEQPARPAIRLAWIEHLRGPSSTTTRPTGRSGRLSALIRRRRTKPPSRAGRPAT